MKRDNEFAEISIKGTSCKVPAIHIDGLTLIILGKLIKTASIKSEPWLPTDVLGDPEVLVDKLKTKHLGIDLFRFSQRLPDVQAIYKYHTEWTDVAAIPISSLDDWWEKLPQVTRKNVRRAQRRGVNIKEVPFSDELVRGIVNINNDTPVRQRGHFYHYGKSFEVVKKDYSAEFLDRSIFLGAYHNNELIGIMRIVYVGSVACIMQILGMSRHFDKRPTNALIAKAVELCAVRGKTYLTYGQYIYAGNLGSPLTEFKRRNGFERIMLPTYYVPLSWKGKLSIDLRLYRGAKQLLPPQAQKVGRILRGLVSSKLRNRSTELD